MGVYRKASLQHAERICGTQPHPQFLIDKQVFADFSISSKWTVDFPHVLDLILTDTKIDKNMVHLSYVHKNIYSRSECDRVTSLTSVKAITGTRAEIRWLPINIKMFYEFETSDQYYHWPHILLDNLPNGVCTVEYYLNGIRWASADFSVIS